MPQQLAQARWAVVAGGCFQDLAGRGMVVPPGAGQFHAKQIGALVVGSHPHREFASAGMGHQEKPGTARSLAENPIHRAVCERNPLFGAGHRLGVRSRAAIARPVECDHGVSVRRAGPQQRRLRMAGTIEIQCGGASAVDSDDHRSRVRRLGDQSGHRHAVDDDEPGLRTYRHMRRYSARSSSTPLGVSPPLLTTPMRASATCRSPASPRNWVIASCSRPMPWVRPCDS